MEKGDKGAMQRYNEFQVKQLTKLIEVTRTDLGKADRQKVMNMITIDAHSRDMVQVRAAARAQQPPRHGSCVPAPSLLRRKLASSLHACASSPSRAAR
jgi:hypothetical protein